MERDLPEGTIDAHPPGGWDPVGDETTHDRNEAAQGYATEAATEADEIAQPDDLESAEPVRQNADPDLQTDADAREER